MERTAEREQERRNGMEIVALDIGNSRTAAAWVADGKAVCAGCVDGYAKGAVRSLLREVRKQGFGGKGPDAVAVCSVVPAQEAKVAAVAAELFPGAPQVRTGWGAEMGLAVDLAAPEQTGADRYADAVAAAALYKGKAVIVCDFGTASTFNLVVPGRGFCGGAIAPGYGLWLETLGRRAAQLPVLDGAEGGAPDIGRDTAGALRAGRSWGFRGMVTEIVWQLTKCCGRRDPLVMATGGWADAVAAGAGFDMDVVPELTLVGAALIAERTLKKRR